jgi:hypothetical protein
MEELDVIELLRPIGSWPARSTGTVLELRPDWALVEVANEHGETLDMIEVPLDQGKVIWAIKDYRSPSDVPEPAGARAHRR